MREGQRGQRELRRDKTPVKRTGHATGHWLDTQDNRQKASKRPRPETSPHERLSEARQCPDLMRQHTLNNVDIRDQAQTNGGFPP